MRPFARWRLLLVCMGICAGVLPLILLEVLLRLTGYGYAPEFIIPIPGNPAYATNEKFGRRFFPALLARTPAPERLTRAKGPHTYRIFILGESAAMGFPEPGFSFGRRLESMLRQMYPDRRFEIVNAAMTAINSHALLPIARDCAGFQPDLFILYAGNNEVVGPYGAGTVFSRRSGNLNLIRMLLGLNGTRAAQWLSTLAPSRSQPAEWRGMEMFLGQAVTADDPRLQTIYENFRRNLMDICAVARGAGAKVIISTVAVNLKDSPPFASAHRTLSQAALRAWEQDDREATALAGSGNHGAALQKFAAARSVDDQFADLRFRTAQSLLAIGQMEAARREFAAARDLDALRFRADTGINRVLRDVAHTAGVRLADAEQVFAKDRIPGEDLFYEHVHLNWTGNDMLARTLLPEVIASLGLAGGVAPDSQAIANDLVYTAWDDYRARADIAAMMRRPPFRERVPDVPPLPAEARGEAATRYRQALQTRPDDLLVRERYADLLVERNDFAAAESQWCDLLGRIPFWQSWRIAFATVLLKENKLDDALREYEVVLRADRSSPTAEFGAGSVLQRQRRWDEASRHYAAALRLNPNYAEVENNLGLMRMEAAGDAAGAIAHYRAALRMKERYPEAHNNLALALSAAGDQDGAIEHYRRASSLDPALVGVQLNLAGTLARRGRIAEAAATYEEALRLHPDQFEAHYGLAGLLAREGQLQRAREHLHVAVKLRPESAEAHYDLGAVCSRQGALREAGDEFTSALQLRPNYAEAWNNLGTTLARAGNLDRAIVCFRKALELRPDLPGARNNLAAALSARP